MLEQRKQIVLKIKTLKTWEVTLKNVWRGSDSGPHMNKTWIWSENIWFVPFPLPWIEVMGHIWTKTWTEPKFLLVSNQTWNCWFLWNEVVSEDTVQSDTRSSSQDGCRASRPAFLSAWPRPQRSDPFLSFQWEEEGEGAGGAVEEAGRPGAEAGP